MSGRGQSSDDEEDVEVSGSQGPPTDERVAQELMALLDGELGGSLRGLRVDVHGVEATLQGVADDDTTEQRALELARAFGGVERVVNRLRVGGGERS